MHTLAALLTGCLWATANAFAGDPPAAHAHHGHEAHAKVAGVRHASDASLRTGMAHIKELLGAPRPADAPAASALADAIDAQVQQLFAQCKLEPEADAALHGVLALLLEGAAGLREDAGSEHAWGRLQQALELYPERFEDPGFGAAP